MAYLIDTDIVIYSLKNDVSVTRRLYQERTTPKSISVITYGELLYGARKSEHVEKNLAVAQRVAELFPVLQVDTVIMDTFGMLKSDLERDGNRLDDMDLIIAATALSHNLVLVTNNENHFGRIRDLQIENCKDE
jgi:tRNA(fMet)-specific endonuclease VapC